MEPNDNKTLPVFADAESSGALLRLLESRISEMARYVEALRRIEQRSGKPDTVSDDPFQENPEAQTCLKF